MFRPTLKITPTERLRKARIACMHHDPTLSGIIMIGKCVTVSLSRDGDKQINTACTNGKDEWYSEEYMETLTDAELRYVVMHENYHKAFRHLITWAHLKRIDGYRANCACDYVINIKLVDQYPETFIKMPDGGLLDPKYRGWDAAKVFYDLPESDGENGRDVGRTGDAGFDEHDWDGAEDMPTEEKKELEKDIDDAIRQGELVAGKTGSGGNRDFDELRDPQIPWGEHTREFVQDTFAGSDYATYNRPNRKFIAAGIYLPSGISEAVGELAILVDTSGSTYAPNVLPAFMSELQGIAIAANPSRVHIIYWDTKVCGAEVYEREELDTIISSTCVKGGGGTDICCVNNYMRDNDIKPQASIVLTDGELFGGWGTWDHPVLWCIIDNKDAKPTHGKALHITASSM